MVRIKKKKLPKYSEITDLNYKNLRCNISSMGDKRHGFQGVLYME